MNYVACEFLIMMERNPSPVDTSVLMRYALSLPSGFQITPVNVVSHAGCNTATLSVSQCKRLYALGKNSCLFFCLFPKNKEGEQVCFSHTPLTGSLAILSMQVTQTLYSAPVSPHVK